MYLEPIKELLLSVNKNASAGNVPLTNGIFVADPLQPLVLLVDFKTEGTDTLDKLRAQLQDLRDLGALTHRNGTQTIERKVTVVVSGKAPRGVLQSNGEAYNDIFFDAQLQTLVNLSVDLRVASNGDTRDTGLDFSGAYYASTSLHSAIGRIWGRRPSEQQMRSLRRQIDIAHAHGLRARFWDTPNWPAVRRRRVWQALLDSGVDVLSVDNLKDVALRNWYKRRSPSSVE
jgi:hypothetical protein